jgi:hypothetical protein
MRNIVLCQRRFTLPKKFQPKHHEKGLDGQNMRHYAVCPPLKAETKSHTFLRVWDFDLVIRERYSSRVKVKAKLFP